MRKRSILVAAVGLVAVVVAGGLFASNMGFKLNYTLVADQDVNSRSGANTLSLPYNPQTDLTQLKPGETIQIPVVKRN